MSVDYLADCATALLNAGRAALAEATTGRTEPASRYVSHDAPIADYVCATGQLTVHLANISHVPDAGSTEAWQTCVIIPTALWVVSLYRCHPGLRDDASDPLPTESEERTAALNLLSDAWALLTEFYDRLAAGTLLPGVDSSDCDVTIGPLEPAESQAKAEGWTFTVSHVLNDTGPIGS